eukprot:4295172-Pleurochrysis_carterae.AAC.1
MSSYRTALDNLKDERKARERVEVECKELRAELTKTLTHLRVGSGVQPRYDHAREELAAAFEKSEALAQEVKEAKAKISKLQDEMDDAKLMYQTATEQLADTAAEHAKALSTLEQQRAALQCRAEAAEQQVAEVAAECVNKGERPRGHAGRAELEDKWELLSESSRRSALNRHTSDVKNALLDAATTTGFQAASPSWPSRALA